MTQLGIEPRQPPPSTPQAYPASWNPVLLLLHLVPPTPKRNIFGVTNSFLISRTAGTLSMFTQMINVAVSVSCCCCHRSLRPRHLKPHAVVTLQSFGSEAQQGGFHWAQVRERSCTPCWRFEGGAHCLACPASRALPVLRLPAPSSVATALVWLLPTLTSFSLLNWDRLSCLRSPSPPG